MEAFERYSQEMERFRKGRLATIYPEFLAYLKTSDFVKSPQLEQLFNISGAEIRQVVQYARRQSVPIQSGGNGYRYARRQDDIEPTLAHLRERRNSLNYTISKLERAFLPDTPDLDFDGGGVSMEEFFSTMDRRE